MDKRQLKIQLRAMKLTNRHYKRYHNLTGCNSISPAERDRLEKDYRYYWDPKHWVPYSDRELDAVKQQIKQLKRCG